MIETANTVAFLGCSGTKGVALVYGVHHDAMLRCRLDGHRCVNFIQSEEGIRRWALRVSLGTPGPLATSSHTPYPTPALIASTSMSPTGTGRPRRHPGLRLRYQAPLRAAHLPAALLSRHCRTAPWAVGTAIPRPSPRPHAMVNIAWWRQHSTGRGKQQQHGGGEGGRRQWYGSPAVRTAVRQPHADGWLVQRGG